VNDGRRTSGPHLAKHSPLPAYVGLQCHRVRAEKFAEMPANEPAGTCDENRSGHDPSRSVTSSPSMARQLLLRSLERARLLRSLFRVHERLTTLRTADSEPKRSEGLPLPPPHLRTLAAGTANTHWFLESGRASAETIRDAVRRHGGDLDSGARMLDFGCGCGRILRHWQHLAKVEIHASEPDGRLAEWCAGNLPFVSVSRSSALPALPYEPDTFDLVYAISVFTHLTEREQLLWITELARIIRPGGLLLLTVHGDRYLNRLTREERKSYEEGRLVIRHASASGTNLCCAFHPAHFVRERLAPGFGLLEHTTGGFERGAPQQDLVVLGKSS
jgi:SAM-dependent methyltransferase